MAQYQANTLEIADITARLEQISVKKDMATERASTLPGSYPISDQDRAKISKLRQVNAELEIILKEQATKIDRLREEIETELCPKYGTPFDQTMEYSEKKKEDNNVSDS